MPYAVAITVLLSPQCLHFMTTSTIRHWYIHQHPPVRSSTIPRCTPAILMGPTTVHCLFLAVSQSALWFTSVCEMEAVPPECNTGVSSGQRFCGCSAEILKWLNAQSRKPVTLSQGRISDWQTAGALQVLQEYRLEEEGSCLQTQESIPSAIQNSRRAKRIGYWSTTVPLISQWLVADLLGSLA